MEIGGNKQEIFGIDNISLIKNIKHFDLCVEINKDDLIDVTLFLKTNKDTKFRQLIDITAVDYPDEPQRFNLIYLFLSHEYNQRIVLNYSISENEVINLYS